MSTYSFRSLRPGIAETHVLHVTASPQHRSGLLRQPPRASKRDDGGDQEQSLRDRARALDRLFYNSSTSTAEQDSPSGSGAGTECSADPDPAVIPNLPLWRVQWAVLPAGLEVLHVHVPHYTDMFHRLLAGPAPRRFGHLYLPGGSVNLGSPGFALAPGTQAPLVGALMEVLQAVTFPDGRLLILAAACGKFKVVEATQELPYSRANVTLLPDVEEMQAQEALATEGLAAVGGDVGMMAAMQGAEAAARRAAAVAGEVWNDYELSDYRVVDKLAVIDGADERTALEFGRRLVAMGAQVVMPLPYHHEAPTRDAAEAAAASEAAAEEAAEAMAEAADRGSPSGGLAAESGQGSEQYMRDGADLRDVATAAQEAAHRSAELMLQRVTGLPDLALPQASAAMGSSLLGRGVAAAENNTTAERGIPSQAPGEVLGPEQGGGAELPDCEASALRYEVQVWESVEAVNRLATKLGMQPLALPAGVACLRPPRREPGSKDPEAAHAAYPSLRRAQRLSYALAAVLTDVSADEGRQAVLEAGSTTARLRIQLARLRKHVNVLAALVAVEDSL